MYSWKQLQNIVGGHHLSNRRMRSLCTVTAATDHVDQG
jgi:hypothetical protein